MPSSRSRVLLISSTLMLAGCGVFGGSRGDLRYLSAEERPPLELPADADRPNTSTALVIPGAALPPPVAGAGPGIAPPGIDEVLAGPLDPLRLSINDSLDNAWRRVGLALERSGVGTIGARDETAATYVVTGTTTERPRADVGWFGRLIGRDKPRNVTVTRVVRVVPSDAGAEVRVEDEAGRAATDAYARRLIAVLRDRLG